MTRKTFNAEGAVSVGPYSHATSSGDLLFLSGQTPLDSETGKLIKGGIGEQTKKSFENLFKVLESAGLTPDDVIKVKVFLTNMDNFEEMNEVYKTQFKKPYPSRTTIGVASLPLYADIEIEMIAKMK